MQERNEQRPMESFEQAQVRESRRSFLATATEALAAVPLVGLGVSNWDSSDTFHQLNFTEAGLSESPVSADGTLERAFQAQAEFREAAAQLYHCYRDDFIKTRIVMSPQSNGDTIKLVPITQHYWDVPDGMADENAVESWAVTAKRTQALTQELKTAELIDINKLERIAIEAKQGDTSSRHVLTALVYGSSIAVLWGYEEAIAFVKAKNNGTTYHEERYENTTATQETRRGFFKIAAALIGAAGAYAIHSNTQERLATGEQRLADELGKAQNTKEAEAEAAISAYFGESLEESIARIEARISSAEESLRTCPTDGTVAPSLTRFIQSGRKYREELQSISSDPESLETLVMLAKCGSATKQLSSASTADERLSTTRVLLEGLGIFGAMAAITTVGGVVNNKFPGEKEPRDY